MPGVKLDDVPEKTDMLFIAEPDLMALHDVSYQDMMKALKNAVSQNSLFSIVNGTHTLPVVSGVGSRSLWETLENTYVNGVPAAEMMRQTYVRDLKSIVSGVEGDYCPVALDVPQREVRGVMAGKHWPRGMTSTCLSAGRGSRRVRRQRRWW